MDGLVQDVEAAVELEEGVELVHEVAGKGAAGVSGAGAMLAGDRTTEAGCLASSRGQGPARGSGSAW